MGRREDVLATRCRDDEIRNPGRLGHREHLEAVHRGFDRLDGIDFRDNDTGAHPARAHRDSAARPAVSRDDERSAGDQQIRGRHETVNGALAGPISVVEEMFHLGIVHIDDREAQGAVSFHRPEANDAGRGLLVSSAYARQQFRSLRVQQEDEVCAIIDHEVRLQIEDLLEIRVILLCRFPLLRIDLEAVGLRKGRGDAVVRRERIARCEPDLCAGFLEREREDPGLRLDVERHRDPQPTKGFLLFQRLADRSEDGHVVPGPFDSQRPSFAEFRHPSADAPDSTSAFRWPRRGRASSIHC